MGEANTTDLFKFLTVRPAQRITEKETQRTTIRDDRATNPDGVNQLARLAQQLVDPREAIERWHQFSLEKLDLLAEGYRELVRRYEDMDAEDDTPNAQELLEKVGISVAQNRQDPRLLHLAFDALYTAERTGADAGLRLETPIAALRVLHFAELLSEDPQPTRSTALEALTATPVIPIAFYETIPVRETPTAASKRNTVSSATQPDSARSTYFRTLATDLNSTERLLETVTNAPAVYSPPFLAEQAQEASGWLRSEFTLSTTPTLNSVFSGQLSRDEVSLLNQLRVTEAVSVPIAAQMLQSHLSKLTQEAFALADDQEFQGYMQELSAPNVAIRSDISTTKLAKPNGDPNNELAPDVDVSGRIIPLGIGDLKVVKQTLLAYVPGEVAHIENVLKGESRERKHRKLDRTETTLFTSEEEATESERDTQTTDRFELKRETELTIKEDMSIKAGLTVTASYGPVVATATGDFAYSTSKQDSAKSSSNFARDVVDRSVSKVQTKTKTERTTKTLNEVEEINTHGVNNAKGDGHVTGIYRWVDKRYRAQIYNYGVRLLLEFIVPEPAAFYRAAQLHKTAKEVNATPPPPFVKVSFAQAGYTALGRVGSEPPLTVGDITEANYLQYASRYKAAGIAPPPPLYTNTSATLVKEGIEAGKTIANASKELVVPTGYILSFYTTSVSTVWGPFPQFSLQVGRELYKLQNDKSGKGSDMFTTAESRVNGSPGNVTDIIGSVPLSVVSYDVSAFSVHVVGTCKRDDKGAGTLDQWKLKTFEKINAAYQALQTAYDQKVAQAEAQTGIMIEVRNPAQNRVIEKTELKKLCITMMTGQDFSQFNAMTDPPDKPKTYPEVDVYEALDEGRIVQFFEQAFEWEQMTYLFYSYFWGRKKNWVNVTQISHPDPMFAQFLTAGAARVVVPVPLAYVDSVKYLLQNPHHKKKLRDKVWKGGERPTIEDKEGLYISITEELRNQTDDLNGAKPEGDPWEFTLPTTLVWLQPDATLPTFGG